MKKRRVKKTEPVIIPDVYYSDQQTAAFLNIKVTTFWQWRSQGKRRPRSKRTSGKPITQGQAIIDFINESRDI